MPALKWVLLALVAGCEAAPIGPEVGAPGLTGARSTTPVSVAVDPGAYTGVWVITGVTGLVNGPLTVDVPVGQHSVQITGFGAFTIDVAGDGTVTVPNGVSATGGIGVLTFATTSVTVDPAAYAGSWTVHQATNVVSGIVTVQLVRGVSYGAFVGGFGSFLFDVAADGTVTVQNGVSATGGLGTLTFVTTQVSIDPAAYAGKWAVSLGSPILIGPATLHLVPEVRYGLFVGAVGTIVIELAADGSVTVLNGVSATGGPQSLVFITTPVAIDPAAYLGTWSLSQVTNALTGVQTLDLVLGLAYQTGIGGFGSFRIDLLADGTVDVLNGESAIGGSGQMTFQTEDITITPDDDFVPWQVDGSQTLTGSQTLALVPEVRYGIYASGPIETFEVFANPCSVSVSPVTSGPVTWDIACGLPPQAPEVSAVVLPAEPLVVGSVVALEASFSDANVQDVHTGTFDWGTGSVMGSVVENDGVGTLSLDQLFDEAGVFTVVATVSDGSLDGSRSSALDVPAYLVIYDPDGGFVTGGGWFNSPAGAFKADPGLVGKANFGFVAKYKKGASVPTGNTEFQFSAGDLNFHSSSYEWLVVNQNGQNAQFRGEGTINGAGVYKFTIWAGDKNPDTFRIRITEVGGGIVYDNGVDQPIDGGSIKIHTK